jgi:diguanylate cyclase (GGDEF)-like protein
MAKRIDTGDALTGLPGKPEFEDLLGRAVDADGELAPVSLAFFDIDHFMDVNQKLGHEKGDEVIRAIASFVSGRLPVGRRSMCRIGGDEFAVVLEKTQKEEAFLLLESARQEVASLEALGGVDPHPTISIGVATYPDDASTRQELVRKADDALYRAKSAGRNRVCLAREEKKVPKTSHYTQGQLDRLAALAAREGVGEAELLREALDNLLKKYSS